MRKQDQIILTKEEREYLQDVVSKGQHLARYIRHAHIILKCAAGWTDAAIAEAFEVSDRTVKRVRKRCLEEGVQASIADKARKGRTVKYGEKAQAMVIATACSPAPAGADHWTLKLLSEKVIELGIDDISRESVRRILKKTSSNRTKKGTGV